MKAEEGERKTYEAFLRALQERKKEGKSYLYCPIRRGWYLSAPEEKVRQHCLYHLLYERRYPASLMAVERQLERTRQGQKQQRIDILVYDRKSMPYLLVECKREETVLRELREQDITQHFEQLLTYNRTLHAVYLALYDGQTCLLLDTKTHTLGKDFPPFAF